MDKPERNKGLTAFKYIVMGILLIFGLSSLFEGISLGQYYRSVEKTSVTVTGRISRIDVEYDSEDGDEYLLYVTYIYNGIPYERYYSTTGNSSVQQDIGKQIDFQIDPKNPGVLLKNVDNKRDMMCFRGALLLGLCALPRKIRVRKSYVESFGMSSQCLKRDLLDMLSRRWGWQFLLVSGGTLLISEIYFGHLSLKMKDVAAIIAVIIGGVQFFNLIKDFLDIMNENFRTRYETVIKKDIHTDSEDIDTHYITCIGENGREWRKKVSAENYDMIIRGDRLLSVYIGTRGRPALNYMNNNCPI